MASSSCLGRQSYRIDCRYRYKDKGGEGGVGLVVLSCCPEASLALASSEKTVELAEIILLGPASMTKARAGVGSRRRTMTKNITFGRYILYFTPSSVSLMASSSCLGRQSYRIDCRYRYKDKGGEGGVGLVVLSCCPEASLALASSEKTVELAEIILLGPASMTKARAGVGSRRRTMTKNITFGRYICVFGDKGGIGMVIRSDRMEGSEAMAGAEVSILMI